MQRVLGTLLTGLAVLSAFGPAGSPAAGQDLGTTSGRLQTALEAMRAGGRTLAGPGVYTRQTGVADIAVQLTSEVSVCGTVTLVDGVSVQLNLRDGLGSNVQGVIANSTLRTTSGCAPNVQNVELQCTGGQPCVAVWRIDAF